MTSQQYEEQDGHKYVLNVNMEKTTMEAFYKHWHMAMEKMVSDQKL